MSRLEEVPPSSFLDEFINKEILGWDDTKGIAPSCSRSKYDVWHLIEFLSKRYTFSLSKHLTRSYWFCELKTGGVKILITGQHAPIAVARAAIVAHKFEGNEIPEELY